MRPPKIFFSLAINLLWIGPAAAGPILDRIKAQGVLHCGGVERPGLILMEDNGKASGLELDMCRAIASVVLGSNGRLEFRRYDSEKAYAAVRSGADDVSFLTGTEIIDNGLAGKVIPGPTIFNETTAIMVPENSPVHHAEELAGQTICFSLASNAQRHLEAWFAARKLPFVRMGFQEDVEMNDGYTVHYCKGLAGETTTLADTRISGETGLNNHRVLPENLAVFPIMAATGTADGQWAAIVAWTIDTLMRADAPESDWQVGGVNSLRIHAPELGLEEGWQKKLVALVGGYSEMYERNLGAKSPFHLPRGLNAGPVDGGVIVAPYSD
jgi:general L-amino acid transport system substrate-binding protein